MGNKLFQSPEIILPKIILSIAYIARLACQRRFRGEPPLPAEAEAAFKFGVCAVER